MSAPSNSSSTGNARGWQLFDSPTVTTHPRRVQSVLNRAASVVCVLACALSAQCVGWQPIPEARPQDSACPLHHHEDGASRTHLTQAPGDDCCAQRPRYDSTPSGRTFASTITLAVLQPLPQVVLSLAPATPLAVPWETASPPTHVPKHLLLSVLVV